MRYILLSALILVGCRGERYVVVDDPEPPTAPLPIETCEQALVEGATGFDCSGLEGGCFMDVGCCVQAAFCEFGRLIRTEDCGACERCMLDMDCGPMAWCVGDGECVPCPPVEECPPCPPELIPLERNGCDTCECAPPTQCVVDEDCGDPALVRCEHGTFCACEDPSCCINSCVGIDGCMAAEPPPEGCLRPCPDDPACPTGVCRQIACQCLMDHWECETHCAMDPTSDC